jgi:hypothetical protein
MFFILSQKLYKETNSLKERFSVQSVQEGRKKMLVSPYTAKNFIYYFRFSFQIHTLTTVELLIRKRKQNIPTKIVKSTVLVVI